MAKGTITSMSCDPAQNGFQPTEMYVLGQNGEEVTTVDGSGNWQRTNVYANGTLLATIDTVGSRLHYQITDALGTRRLQTDEWGWPDEECQNAPYGDDLNCGAPTGGDPTADDATQLHFTGKHLDGETGGANPYNGNDYFGARYYGPYMGRFLTPDWSAKVEPVPYSKLSDPQSLNLYAYVRNNPLGSVDPDGHDCNGWCDLQGNAYQTDSQIAAAARAAKADAARAAQQQSQSTTSTGDPIQNALQKDVPGVSTVTPDPDPKLDKAHGGHQNETFALTFKTPAEQAAFLKESGRKGLFHKDNGFGPGVRLDGGLHVEHGRLDPTNSGAILVTSHIDRFNPNNGLGPMIGHFVVDMGIGETFCSSSACLDH